jgi:exodeoxyribonuclease VII small subunit
MATFEEHLTQLETVVEKLERGELTLDESVRLFEEGVKLSNACKQELEQAEGRIQVLVEGKGGKMQVADLELEPTDEVDVEEEADE